jgi:hypothetical protein
MISLSKFKSIKTPAIVSELSGFASLSVSHEKIVLIGLISDDVLYLNKGTLFGNCLEKTHILN